LINAFANSFGVFFLPVNPPIREAFAFDALEGDHGTHVVIDAEADAVVVAEIELREITVQMVLAAMLIDALHAALEDGEVAFDGVGVDIATDILISAVVDALMVCKLAAKLCLDTALIGHQAAFTADIVANDRRNGSDARMVNMERAQTTLALDKAENGALVSKAALHRNALAATDIGFVGFDDFAGTANGRECATAHCFANTMRHEPRGFVGRA